MHRTLYLDAAKRDLVAIFTSIAREYESNAMGRTFVARLRRHCGNLASLSSTFGRSCPELGMGIRTVPCEGYVIFFRNEDEVLEVLNIRRDIDGPFQGD